MPSPRFCHATTSLGNKAWLYGGTIKDIQYDIDYLYELDMCSITWTQIQTTTPKPPRLSTCSFNVTRENQVFHTVEKVMRGIIYLNMLGYLIYHHTHGRNMHVMTVFDQIIQGLLELTTVSLLLVVVILRMTCN